MTPIEEEPRDQEANPDHETKQRDHVNGGQLADAFLPELAHVAQPSMLFKVAGLAARRCGGDAAGVQPPGPRGQGASKSFTRRGCRGIVMKRWSGAASGPRATRRAPGTPTAPPAPRRP